MEAKEPIAMYDTVVKYAKDNNVTPYEYGSYYLKNATFFYSIGSAGRAWTYQWCSELGWLQVRAGCGSPALSRPTGLCFYVCCPDFSPGQLRHTPFKLLIATV